MKRSEVTQAIAEVLQLVAPELSESTLEKASSLILSRCELKGMRPADYDYHDGIFWVQKSGWEPENE